MAKKEEREGKLVGVWFSDEEIEKLDRIANSLRWLNRSEVLRHLLNHADEAEVIRQIIDESIPHTQDQAPRRRERQLT